MTLHSQPPHEVSAHVQQGATLQVFKKSKRKLHLVLNLLFMRSSQRLAGGATSTGVRGDSRSHPAEPEPDAPCRTRSPNQTTHGQQTNKTAACTSSQTASKGELRRPLQVGEGKRSCFSPIFPHQHQTSNNKDAFDDLTKVATYLSSQIFTFLPGPKRSQASTSKNCF